MGSSKLSEEELAGRIRPDRYELAAKSEVHAFVTRRLRALSTIVDEEIDEQRVATHTRIDGVESNVQLTIQSLANRISELEMTRWQLLVRAWQLFKRRFNEFVEDVIFALSSDPTILPHGTQAELDADDAAAFAIEREMKQGVSPARFEQLRAEGKINVIDTAGFEPLCRALRELPTEYVEDLAENPVLSDAIREIKKAGAIVPELQGLPEYTAEEMPSVPEQQRTHDGELENLRPLYGENQGAELGYMSPGSFRVGERADIPPEELFPNAVRNRETLGDPEE